MRQRRSTEERRQQIADAALMVIAADGLNGFTTAAIARAVEIAEGTVFRHFRTKEEIVAAAIERLGAMFQEATPEPTTDPVARLQAFFKRRVALLDDHPGVARLLFSDQLAAAAGEDSARLVHRLREEAMRFVRACFVEADAAGRLRTGMTLDDLVMVFVGAILALVQQQDFGGASRSLSERAERLWETLARLLFV